MTFGESRKRVLVLVLAMDAQPWRMIEDKGQRETWAAEPRADVPAFWLYGRTGMSSTMARYAQRAVQRFAPAAAFRAYSRLVGTWLASRPVRLAGDRLVTGVPETYLNTNAKNMSGLRHLLATLDFDYVFRTNTSSYVNLSMLEDYVQALPDTGFYGGFVGERDGTKFASGTCTLMSRDLVEYAVNDQAWEFGLIDDVAMGRSMARASVEVQPLNRLDVLTPEDLNALTSGDLEGAFIVRCKSSGGREHDIEAMHRVHQLYAEEAATK
ncbi:hypothetical protein AU252_19690 [Pseudarthrobacter sulfonivorans]|uniref:Uncharacterized protein n=1 Tax=Pseudarthrobacter sulfonivorans TaxID=121292 RepID=A0A0U3PC84_9MICC|nr:hypothetical protein [Pseudarthrobacter sulfonivorans]ALV43104.1 hypothetical protein AU252_19690 [Pseudarthrobacter sulfonivorans]